MDANNVLRTELAQHGVEHVNELDAQEIVELALRYAVWLPVSTYERAPWLAPFAIRKIRIRTDAAAPGPARDLWGLPDASGHFTDDNSLIKGVVLRSRISPATGPYGNGVLTRGLVCCHVWSGSTSNPLLFSFVPNLVWLPRELARYSDAHLAGPAHILHDKLKQVSTGRFRKVRPRVAERRVESAWTALGAAEPVVFACHEADVGDRVVQLVAGRVARLERFLIGTLSHDSAPPERFSKRYHAGAGKGIDSSVWPAQSIVSEANRRALLGVMRTVRPPQ